MKQNQHGTHQLELWNENIFHSGLGWPIVCCIWSLKVKTAWRGCFSCLCYIHTLHIIHSMDPKFCQSGSSVWSKS